MTIKFFEKLESFNNFGKMVRVLARKLFTLPVLQISTVSGQSRTKDDAGNIVQKQPLDATKINVIKGEKTFLYKIFTKTKIFVL